MPYTGGAIDSNNEVDFENGERSYECMAEDFKNLEERVQAIDDSGGDNGGGFYEHVDMRSVTTRFEFVFDVVIKPR